MSLLHAGVDTTVIALWLSHADLASKERALAHVITLKGRSYRLKNTGIDTLPSARAEYTAQ